MNSTLAKPVFEGHGLAALVCCVFAFVSQAAGQDAGAFFESRIRPLLVSHCQECHGAQKQKGGLRLDSRAGWEKGGDSGPAITPGDHAASLLMKAVSYTDRDLKMPPEKKLSPAQISDIRQWIALGAHDPRESATTSTGKQHALSVSEGKAFWSYRPPSDPEPPRVKETSWPLNEIDHFILAKLEEKGLKPAPDADAGTLRRRLAFDLTGLPPAAAGAGGSEGRVDALLATPAYAERMASHWLDIARFAESSGGGRTLPFKDAWRYRDYVIESFQSDVPVNRFITEQIAGDLMPAPDAAARRRQLTATSFLVLGPTNYEEQDKQMLRMDIVDEQLDTIGKSLLGQTIGCARCHDHKFDPIPITDYYALAGIFRSTRTLKNYTDNVAHWIDTPLPLDGEDEARMAAHEAKTGALRKEIATLKDLLRGSAGNITTEKKAFAPASLPGIVVDDAEAMKVGEWTVSARYKPYIGAGYSHDKNGDKGAKTISFTPKIPKTGRYEVRVAFNAGPTRAEKVPVTVFHADGEELVQIQQKTEAVDGMEFVSAGTFRFEDSGQGYVLLSNAGTQGYVTVDAVQFLPEASSGAVVADAGKSAPERREVREMKSRLSRLERELKQLENSGPRRAEVMAVREDDQIEDCPVHIRGSIRNLGAVVPRGFLSVTLGGEKPAALPKDQSGRLEFAAWLASDANPLTARVYVNRVWHWLMGAGIVRTTENFGTTGEAPSHPELLDYLARRFMREGWSTQKLVKLIVSSRTYRQSSTPHDPRAAEADPDNRLLWRMNRKRLDAECIRDAVLAAAGALDLRRLGPNMTAGEADSNSTATQNLEYNFEFKDTRRSVYTPAFRNVRHPLFEVFDFADVNQPIAQRTTSTIAPQALFMTNHPFVITQARAAADRLMKHGSGGSERIALAYEESLGRTPAAEELAACLDFVEAARSGNATPADIRDIWARLVQALWSTPDFRFLR